MNLKKADQKKVILGFSALAIILMVVFVFGKMSGRNDVEQREIDIKVNIKDENGQHIIYNPTELLARLYKGLTTRYYFDFSERCNPIQELYELDATRFMAAVQAYQEKYNEPITKHMDACYIDCLRKGSYKNENYFDLIKNRIHNLKDLIN